MPLGPLPAPTCCRPVYRESRKTAKGATWCTILVQSKSFRCNTSDPLLCVANKELAQYISPLNATLIENVGGGVVMVNQPSHEGFENRKDGAAFFFLTDNYKLKTGNRPAAKRSQSTPRIMSPRLQGSTPCIIARLAAPDGMSAKLVTACGDSPAGPAPMTLSRSTPCSAPWISAAISSTLRGPTAKAAANRSLEKFSAPTPARGFTSPQKFRLKILSGPAAAISRWTIAIRRTTSRNTSTKVSPTSASKNSTSSSFTLG